jgi:branched-chain amino acid transport system permease protein
VSETSAVTTDAAEAAGPADDRLQPRDVEADAAVGGAPPTVQPAGAAALGPLPLLDRSIILAVVVGVVVAMPWMVSGTWLFLLTLAMVQAIAAAGLVVIFRATGSLVFCQTAFMGVGAAGVSWLVNQVGWPISLAVPVAVVGTGVIGSVLAFPALRLQGVDLSVLTLLFAQAVNALVFASAGPLHPTEFGIFVASPKIFGLTMTDPKVGYSIGLLITIAAFAATGLLLRSRVGNTWRVRDAGNTTAAACGINITRQSLLGFFLGAVLAAVAGVLLLLVTGALDTTSLGPLASIGLVVVVVIGGVSDLRAALLAGAVLGVASRLGPFFGVESEWIDLVLGVAVIGVILKARSGIGGAYRAQ